MNDLAHQAHWLDPSHWLDSTWPKARIVIAGTAAVLVLVLLIILSKIIRSLCCCCCDWRPQLVKTNDTIPSSIQAEQSTQPPKPPRDLNIVQYLKTSVIRAYYSCYHPNMEVNKFCRFFSPWVVYHGMGNFLCLSRLWMIFLPRTFWYFTPKSSAADNISDQ